MCAYDSVTHHLVDITHGRVKVMVRGVKATHRIAVVTSQVAIVSHHPIEAARHTSRSMRQANINSRQDASMTLYMCRTSGEESDGRLSFPAHARPTSGYPPSLSSTRGLSRIVVAESDSGGASPDAQGAG